MQGFFRLSRAALASQQLGSGGNCGKSFFSRIKFGNPFADDYPEWIWRGLKNSRRGKDCAAPLFRLLNSTRIYETVLKNNWSYWTFVLAGGMTSSFLWSEGWNAIWRKVNKGKLYNDCPYIYPEDE